MAPILTVVGATGAQGGSVVNSALKSGLYHVRAITRITDSEKAKALTARGVEVVAANLDDENSLVKAFEGSTAIFAVTNFFEPFSTLGADAAITIEVKQGRNLANAASKTKTLQHYIWSTLPDSEKISNGEHSVPHLQGKVQIDALIKANAELYEKTTFLWVSFYAQNYLNPLFVPNLVKSSGKYIQLSPVPSTLSIQSIGDVSYNIGVFASAILAQPSLTKGKYVLASVESITLGESLQVWSEATGKDTLYVQIASVEAYDSIWPTWGKEIGIMLKFWESVGATRSWSGEETVLGRKELGIKDEEVVGSKEVFEKLDWSFL